MRRIRIGRIIVSAICLIAMLVGTGVRAEAEVYLKSTFEGDWDDTGVQMDSEDGNAYVYVFKCSKNQNYYYRFLDTEIQVESDSPIDTSEGGVSMEPQSDEESVTPPFEYYGEATYDDFAYSGTNRFMLEAKFGWDYTITYYRDYENTGRPHLSVTIAMDYDVPTFYISGEGGGGTAYPTPYGNIDGAWDYGFFQVKLKFGCSYTLSDSNGNYYAYDGGNLVVVEDEKESKFIWDRITSNVDIYFLYNGEYCYDVFDNSVVDEDAKKLTKFAIVEVKNNQPEFYYLTNMDDYNYEYRTEIGTLTMPIYLYAANTEGSIGTYLKYGSSEINEQGEISFWNFTDPNSNYYYFAYYDPLIDSENELINSTVETIHNVHVKLETSGDAESTYLYLSAIGYERYYYLSTDNFSELFTCEDTHYSLEYESFSGNFTIGTENFLNMPVVFGTDNELGETLESGQVISSLTENQYAFNFGDEEVYDVRIEFDDYGFGPVNFKVTYRKKYVKYYVEDADGNMTEATLDEEATNSYSVNIDKLEKDFRIYAETKDGTRSAEFAPTAAKTLESDETYADSLVEDGTELFSLSCNPAYSVLITFAADDDEINNVKAIYSEIDTGVEGVAASEGGSVKTGAGWIEVDSRMNAVYGCDGVLVGKGESRYELEPGIYLVVVNGHVRKVLIK